MAAIKNGEKILDQIYKDYGLMPDDVESVERIVPDSSSGIKSVDYISMKSASISEKTAEWLDAQTPEDLNYGFMSTEKFRGVMLNVAQHDVAKHDYEPDSLEEHISNNADQFYEYGSKLANVNPTIQMSSDSMMAAINDPSSFDNDYQLTPISPSDKTRLDNISIDELENASVQDVLYLTRDVAGTIRLPGDPGYEDWHKLVELRQEAESVLAQATSVPELNGLLDNMVIEREDTPEMELTPSRKRDREFDDGGLSL